VQQATLASGDNLQGDMADTALSLRNLRYAWPGQPPLLHVPALDIARGERVFLRGGSGSGKSTLLGLISGVLAPQAGDITLFGEPLGALSQPARDRLRGDRIGYIFQMFNLIPWLDVLGNVLLPLQFSAARRERCGPDATGAASALLRALGISPEQLGLPTAQLSVGQQQRVAAARALLGAPPLILADEPTSALDTDHRDRFVELLLAQCAASGATLVFVSHDATLAPHFDRQLQVDAWRA
jgi:putative ABC transport system ATP-binding protein